MSLRFKSEFTRDYCLLCIESLLNNFDIVLWSLILLFLIKNGDGLLTLDNRSIFTIICRGVVLAVILRIILSYLMFSAILIKKCQSIILIFLNCQCWYWSKRVRVTIRLSLNAALFPSLFLILMRSLSICYGLATRIDLGCARSLYLNILHHSQQITVLRSLLIIVILDGCRFLSVLFTLYIMFPFSCFLINHLLDEG